MLPLLDASKKRGHLFHSVNIISWKRIYCFNFAANLVCYCSCTFTRKLGLVEYDQYIFALLEAGATGYLLKDVPSQKLISGVRAVHAGELALHPVAARKARTYFVGTAGKKDEPRAQFLTDREKGLTAGKKLYFELVDRGYKRELVGLIINQPLFKEILTKRLPFCWFGIQEPNKEEMKPLIFLNSKSLDDQKLKDISEMIMVNMTKLIDEVDRKINRKK